MASWEDGPEYAPLQRPADFVTPPTPPLSEPEAAPPAEVLPEVEPRFAPPTNPGPELTALVPDAGLDRNPKIAFEVSAAAITSASGADRSPLQPFAPPGPSLNGYLPMQSRVAADAQVNPVPFPAPGTPQWFAPPPPAAPTPTPVTVSQILTASTPAVLIVLAIGAFFSWLSLFMFALAFSLSARIAYRRPVIRRVFGFAVAGVATIGTATMLTNGFYADVLFEGLVTGAQLACWVLPVVIVLIVASALRAGERPEQGL